MSAISVGAAEQRVQRELREAAPEGPDQVALSHHIHRELLCLGDLHYLLEL